MSAVEKDAQKTAAVIPSTTSKVRPGRMLESIGDLLQFAFQAIRLVPSAFRHELPEVIRHAGVMVKYHLFIILTLAGMMGAMLAIVGSYVFESIGLESYAAIIVAIPMVRGVLAIVFGWVFAAKAGCGIVAEVGAMRISEEIDALEVMGVPSLPYLVATRLAASLVVVPAMYVAAMFVHFQVAQFFFVHFLDSVSNGGYVSLFYQLQRPQDFVFTALAGTVVGFIVTLTSCYYGYKATGGPVGLGRSTAQSMLVNLVLIGLAVMVMVQVMYGNTLVSPVGG